MRAPALVFLLACITAFPAHAQAPGSAPGDNDPMVQLPWVITTVDLGNVVIGKRRISHAQLLSRGNPSAHLPARVVTGCGCVNARVERYTPANNGQLTVTFTYLAEGPEGATQREICLLDQRNRIIGKVFVNATDVPPVSVSPRLAVFGNLDANSTKSIFVTLSRNDNVAFAPLTCQLPSYLKARLVSKASNKEVWQVTVDRNAPSGPITEGISWISKAKTEIASLQATGDIRGSLLVQPESLSISKTRRAIVVKISGFEGTDGNHVSAISHSPYIKMYKIAPNGPHTVQYKVVFRPRPGHPVFVRGEISVSRGKRTMVRVPYKAVFVG
jgi:hypothetical protein